MTDKNSSKPASAEVEITRREAIAKLSACASLAGPAVTTLLISNKATAQSFTVGGGGAPGSVRVNPYDPEGNEVCFGGGGTCP